jgi:hypothetical protein
MRPHGYLRMRTVRGLVLVAGAAALALASALSWREGVDFDVRARGGAITPTGMTGAAAPRGGVGRPGASQVEQAPPEVVILARRGVSPLPTWGSPASDHLPLAQQLQRELARVGCYEGEINGVWTPTTRQALKAFLDRLNAILPTGAPDPVQLAMLATARGRVCGVACPAGETLEGGRCIPNVVLAGRKFGAAPSLGSAGGDPGSSGAAGGPLAGDAPRAGLAASPVLAASMGERGEGSSPPQTADGISTRGQAPPAPKHQRSPSGFFGFSIFKELGKLGF